MTTSCCGLRLSNRDPDVVKRIATYLSRNYEGKFRPQTMDSGHSVLTKKCTRRLDRMLSVLLNGLTTELQKRSNKPSPQASIRAGPLKLTALATSPAALLKVRGAYVASIVTCLDICLLGGGLRFRTDRLRYFMQWRNLKTISKERKRRKSSDPAPVYGYRREDVGLFPLPVRLSEVNCNA